eukprot:485228_1
MEGEQGTTKVKSFEMDIDDIINKNNIQWEFSGLTCCERRQKCHKWAAEQGATKWAQCCFCFFLCIITPLLVSTMVIYLTNRMPITKYVDLYENNITLNVNANDGVIIDTLFIWNRNDLEDYNGFKSIAYKYNTGIIMDSYGESNNISDDCTDSYRLYTEDNWYYIEMYFNSENTECKDQQVIKSMFSYTLSSDYLCCANTECQEFQLHLPWLHRWKYKDIVRNFSLNVLYEYPMELETTSNWDETKKYYDEYYDDPNYGVEDDVLYKIDRFGVKDKNFIIYFNSNINGSGYNTSSINKSCNNMPYSSDVLWQYDYYIIPEQIMGATYFILMMVAICLCSVICLYCYGCCALEFGGDTSSPLLGSVACGACLACFIYCCNWYEREGDREYD